MKYKAAVCLTLITICLHCAVAQEIVVDWAAKKVLSQPSIIEKTTATNVRLENVNDLMYTYSVAFQVKPAPTSDLDAIAKAFSLAGRAAAGEAANDCRTQYATNVLPALDAMSKEEKALREQPATNKGCSVSHPCNIPLSQALSAWKDTVQPKIDAANTALDTFEKSCTDESYGVGIKAARDSIRETLAIVNGNHLIVKDRAIQLVPDSITSVEVIQLWNDTPTNDGTYSVDLQPGNTRLTLSGGALFSEVQNRSYTVRVIPNAGGTGTTNALSVDGVSKFNPTAVALLNYRIPGLDFEQLGFAISSGPVFRLGSKSDTSSFGFFAGLSVHLFHRFYVTPGTHFGEFADFPEGFSHSGQIVPSGLGTPTPTKRWTWRFGFSLSYKAKDFGQFGLASSVTPSKPKSADASNTTDTSIQNKNDKTPKKDRNSKKHKTSK